MRWNDTNKARLAFEEGKTMKDVLVFFGGKYTETEIRKAVANAPSKGVAAAKAEPAATVEDVPRTRSRTK